MVHNYLAIRLLARIPLFVAVLIIGLHAFLPHVHAAGQLRSLALHKTEQPATELIQLLSNIFDLDLGEGHLEHITPDGEGSWEVDFSTPLLLPPNLLLDSPFAAISERTEGLTCQAEDFPPDHHHLATATLRGPPFFA